MSWSDNQVNDLAVLVFLKRENINILVRPLLQLRLPISPDKAIHG